MAPVKRPPIDDTRIETSKAHTTATNPRSKKSATAATTNGNTNLRDANTIATTLNGSINASSTAATTNSILPSSAQATGMFWTTAPPSLLDSYRIAHDLPIPAAFSTPLRQARLTNPGIGRQSPTMARAREKRRVGKEQLALAVRKHFNGAAVNEVEVVVELLYKVKNKDKTFKMRSAHGVAKR